MWAPQSLTDQWKVKGTVERMRFLTINLCALSKDAWKVWVNAGQPSSGPEFDEKCRLRCEVRQTVRFNAGKAELEAED